MKKITLGMLLLSSFLGFSQVTLIDPNGDGGFETGATFAANGWFTAQQNGPNKKWYCGTGQTGFTGARAAFIGNSETTVGNNNAARTVHLYRPITIPAGATNIVLSFKYKQEVSDFAGTTYYDFITVATGTDTPTNTNVFTTGTNHFGPFPNVDVPTFTTQTVTLPNSLAGTTTNLVFTFISDDVNPRGFGAIDDVSLVYTPDLSTNSVEKNPIVFYPNPVKDILHLSNTETIENITVFNTLGQIVMVKEIKTPEGIVDLSSLSSGNYTVKVKTQNTAQSIKIIKE